MDAELREPDGAGTMEEEPRTNADRTCMKPPGDFSSVRVVNGVRIIGPGLFTRDPDGRPLSPIATVFPRFETIVTGRGIHATQAEIFLEYLQEQCRDDGERLDAETEKEVLDDAVALIVRDGRVLLRSDPKRMDRVFAADELLRRLIPKEKIQFTGAHLPEVRTALRRRGESWRITPTPRDVEEMCGFIEASKVTVGTNTVYYHNAPTGGRFLTYENFIRIRPLIRDNPQEALASLNEILDLTELINDQGARELSFFLPAGRSLDTSPLRAAVEELKRPGGSVELALQHFDSFARAFAEAAGAELLVDDPSCAVWRKTMYCRLSDINEEAVEEWTLGLSSEFFLNVKWLPGARITKDGVCFEPNCESRVQRLIEYYLQEWEGLISINVGRIASPQATRERAGGERRDVYLVVLSLADGREDIRIVRMIKWDVTHRLDRGMSLNQAIGETLQYREYIFDRLKATELLGIPVPKYSAIELTEHRPGLGWIPIIYFDRPYFPGIATDKIPLSYYKNTEFVLRLAPLLGQAAATSAVLGRANPETYHVFFDDGDEIIQLDEQGLPARILLADTTGSFTDWVSPVERLLFHCYEHVATHLGRARVQGVPASALAEAVRAFASGVAGEINRLKEGLDQGGLKRLQAEFGRRSCEPGGIRNRVEGVIKRLKEADPEALRLGAEKSPAFHPFLPG